MMMKRRFVCVMAVLMLAVGCAKPTDYSAYLAHMPRSVLVLPPLNNSAEVMASNGFLSTVTTPLAEQGYYVFPMAIVDQMMKDNGMPTPGEMHQVPLHKLGEVFGADAVLYITIKEWGQQYIVIQSKVEVTVAYRLVDVKTGRQLWEFEQTVANARGGIHPQDLIATAIHAGVSAVADKARDLAAQANAIAFTNPNHGLLIGHYNPGYEDDQAKRKEDLRKQQEKAAAAGAG